MWLRAGWDDQQDGRAPVIATGSCPSPRTAQIVRIGDHTTRSTDADEVPLMPFTLLACGPERRHAPRPAGFYPMVPSSAVQRSSVTAVQGRGASLLSCAMTISRSSIVEALLGAAAFIIVSCALSESV